jgi:hypothetical protein
MSVRPMTSAIISGVAPRWRGRPALVGRPDERRAVVAVVDMDVGLGLDQCMSDLSLLGDTYVI